MTAWDFISMFIKQFEVRVDSFRCLFTPKSEAFFMIIFLHGVQKLRQISHKSMDLVKPLFPRDGILLCTRFVFCRICPVSVRNKSSSLRADINIEEIIKNAIFKLELFPEIGLEEFSALPVLKNPESCFCLCVTQSVSSL